MMRRWLLFPLKDTEAINARLDAVEQLMRDTGTRNAVTARLEGVGDMERIISKVAVGRVSPRELVFCATHWPLLPTCGKCAPDTNH